MKDAIDFALLALVYVFVFYGRWRAKGRDVLVVNTVMYVYLAFVLYFTLMPVIASLPSMFNHSYVPMNLEPFIDVALGRGDYIRQIVLNVIMTVPLGFLFPLARGGAGLLKTVGVTLLLSLGIELLQPLMSGGRSSDITDVITNVAGGAVGYGMYLVFKPLTTKVLEYIKGTETKS